MKWDEEDELDVVDATETKVTFFKRILVGQLYTYYLFFYL